MIHAAHQAWKTDHRRGLTSLLIAADNDTVQALNLTVRADLIKAGEVRARGVALHDGTVAGIGDRIITRRVDRRLSDGTNPAGSTDERGRLATGFVKNGTVFTITDVRRDGTIRARATGGRAGIGFNAGVGGRGGRLFLGATGGQAEGGQQGQQLRNIANEFHGGFLSELAVCAKVDQH